MNPVNIGLSKVPIDSYAFLVFHFPHQLLQHTDSHGIGAIAFVVVVLKARRRVDFHDDAAAFFQRHSGIKGDHIDAGQTRAHDLGRAAPSAIIDAQSRAVAVILSAAKF